VLRGRKAVHEPAAGVRKVTSANCARMRVLRRQVVALSPGPHYRLREEKFAG
jgi:hypothetical protein